MDAFSDLLGPPKRSDPQKDKPRARRARMRLSENERRLKTAKFQLHDDALGGDKEIHPEPLPASREFLRPVSANFIGDILNMPAAKVHRRLAKCPTVGSRPHGNKDVPYYNFVEALSYLIEPKGSIDDWFASKNAATLPPYINKMWWDSAHQRHRVMIAANDLWHTEDVMMVLGRVALTIKEESRLWIEELPGRDELTDKQYSHLMEQVTLLQNNIRERMLTLPSEGNTQPMSATIRDELQDAGRLPESQTEDSGG